MELEFDYAPRKLLRQGLIVVHNHVHEAPDKASDEQTIRNRRPDVSREKAREGSGLFALCEILSLRGLPESARMDRSHAHGAARARTKSIRH